MYVKQMTLKLVCVMVCITIPTELNMRKIQMIIYAELLALLNFDKISKKLFG